MKKIQYLMLFMIVLAAGCTPEDFDDIGEPFDRTANLAGTWTITNVVQIDEDAVRKGFPEFVQRLDITNKFSYSDYQIQFVFDESGNPLTFNSISGNAPDIIGFDSGSFSVDDPDYPNILTFTSNGESRTLGLFTYVGLTEGTLKLKFSRAIDEVEFMSYIYTFSKSEQ